MTASYDPSQVYRSLGVKPIINAAGTTTLFGGTKTRPEALQVMAQAARVLVNVDELNLQAGKVIAELTGAEGRSCSQRRRRGASASGGGVHRRGGPEEDGASAGYRGNEKRIHYPAVSPVSLRPGVQGGGS